MLNKKEKRALESLVRKDTKADGSNPLDDSLPDLHARMVGKAS